jgi:hypothetical protein
LAAPRIGFALGIDTNGMLHTSRLVLPEVQLEYQITSLHNWVSVAGGPPATVSPPISENVLAVGVYTARRQHPDLQLGITGIFRYGGEVSLLTAGTPDAGDARPHDFGLVTSFRYLF